MAIRGEWPSALSSSANARTWKSVSERTNESPMVQAKVLVWRKKVSFGSLISTLTLSTAVLNLSQDKLVPVISSMTLGVVYSRSLIENGSKPAKTADASMTIALFFTLARDIHFVPLKRSLLLRR